MVQEKVDPSPYNSLKGIGNEFALDISRPFQFSGSMLVAEMVGEKTASCPAAVDRLPSCGLLEVLKLCGTQLVFEVSFEATILGTPFLHRKELD